MPRLMKESMCDERTSCEVGSDRRVVGISEDLSTTSGLSRTLNNGGTDGMRDSGREGEKKERIE